MNLPYDLGKTGRTASMFLALYSAAEAVFILYCFYLFRFFTQLETGNMTQPPACTISSICARFLQEVSE